MSVPQDDGRIPELETLRAPRRTDAERHRMRERILAAAELLLARRRRSGSSWEVLAAWARPGLLAASIALAILAGAVQPWRGRPEEISRPVVLEDVLRGAGELEGMPAMLVAMNEPDADAVMAAALVERNGNGGEPPAPVEQR